MFDVRENNFYNPQRNDMDVLAADANEGGTQTSGGQAVNPNETADSYEYVFSLTN